MSGRTSFGRLGSAPTASMRVVGLRGTTLSAA